MAELEPFGEQGIALSAFFIADHAEAVGGKLYANGACWDTLAVRELPAQHPHLSVGIAFHVAQHVSGRTHRIEVKLVDQDMQDVVPPLRGELTSRPRPDAEPGEISTAVMAFNIINVRFSAEGSHSCLLYVDGTELARARFKVAVRPR